MIKDINGLIESVSKQMKEQTDVAVVGLSGGADSTLVACLAVKALGVDNVVGVHMPYNNLDKETFNSASKLLVNKLGIQDRTVDIGPAVDTLKEQFSSLSTLNQGNMRSRMRMVSLYTTCCGVAEKTGKRVRVIGTGNMSEDVIGFDTKGGDALCDFFPIGSLLKSEVYQLLEYFSNDGLIEDNMIDRVPSAGLWDGQTDEGELGYSYAEMEFATLNGFNGIWNLDDSVSKFVHDRHFANKHKHEGPPAFNLREFCE